MLMRKMLIACLPPLALGGCGWDEISSSIDTEQLELRAEIVINENGVDVWATPNCEDSSWSMTRLTEGDAIIASLGSESHRLKRFNRNAWEYRTEFDGITGNTLALWLERANDAFQSDNGTLVPLPQQPIASSNGAFTVSTPLPIEWRLQTPIELTRMRLRLTVDSCADQSQFARMRTSINTARHTFSAQHLLDEEPTGAQFIRAGTTLPATFDCRLTIAAEVISEPQLVSDVTRCSVVHAIARNEFQVTFTHE